MDDSNSDLEEQRIDRQRRAMLRAGDGGDLSQRIGSRDPRFSKLIGWAWVTLGGLAILIGVGMYSKLSAMNDTLISVAADLKNQGNQVAELKAEQRDLRSALGSLQRQVDSLEGKTLRGIEEVKRGQ